MIQAVFTIIAGVGGFLFFAWFALRELFQGEWIVAAIYAVAGVWILRKYLRLDELESDDTEG
jgi:hypothetical protein